MPTLKLKHLAHPFRTIQLDKSYFKPRKKYFFASIFIIGIVISCIMLFSNRVIELKIAAFFIFTFFAAASVKFNILHPFIWFNPMFMLYSISGPLLVSIGTHPWRMFAGGIKPSSLDFATTLDLSFIAILIFSIFLGPGVRNYQRVSYAKFEKLRGGAKWVFVIGFGLSILHIGNNIFSGFSDKAQAVLTGSPFAGFAIGFSIMNTVALVYLLDFFRRNEIKKVILFCLSYFSFLFLSLLLAGHRNILYRFLFIFLMLYCISYRRISLKYLVLIFLIFVGSMSVTGILQNLKMGLLKDTISFEPYIDILKKHPELRNPGYILFFKQRITTILGTEFMTASNNLGLIIRYFPENFPFLWGESFWWDIKRALVPGFLFNRVVECTSDYYNRTFFPSLYYLGQGPGFTLVGLPYMNFGTIGIVPFFAFYGFIMKKIYKWSTKSVIGMLFYVSFIPIAVLGIRYDSSALISQSWKHVLLPLGIMLFIGHVERKTLLGRKRCIAFFTRNPL